MEDWRIIGEIGRRINPDVKMTYDSPKEIFDELAALTPQYAGMDFERLEKPGGLQWPCPDKDHPGTPYLHKDKFARGKGLFHSVEHVEPAELPDEEYPMTLTTGRVMFHYHTGTMTRRSPKLDKEVPSPFVEINPADASTLGIKNEQIVKVITRRGEIRLAARIDSAVGPGLIFIPFHFAEAAANVLTNPALDPLSKIPEYKVCAARVEAAG